MRCVGLALVLAGSLASAPAWSGVFYTQQEALALAFPEADRVESRTVILGDAQAAAVEARARAPLDTRILKIHTGWRDREILGFALIDVHTVRTRQQALMVVLTPAGRVRSLRVLAFYEPQDYLPTDRWYRQFVGAESGRALRVGRDVHAVLGATLSARAVARSVRRTQAIYEALSLGDAAQRER